MARRRPRRGDGNYDPALTQRAAASKTVVYTVGLGSATNLALLDGIATATGGKFFLVADAADLLTTFGRIGGNLGAADTDGDGLSDAAEKAGLRDGTGRRYVTDPAKADTDGDTLSDGEEAGSLSTGAPFGAGSWFRMPSDPTRVDTDRDGLDDADETQTGLRPRSADTDADSINDGTETELGFDPLAADGDKDRRRDDRELREGTDPFTYDLDNADKAKAVIGGLVFGDSGRSWVARNIARIAESHVTSPWYLAGWLVGGYLVVGDIRDAVYGLVKGNFGDAALAAIGLVPFAGDAVKTAATAVKYLRFAPKAAGAALRWLSRNLPRGVFRRVADDAAQVAAASARLPQDVAVAGRLAPRALPLSRPIGRSATQNARVQNDIAALQARGATNFRVNQWQVDVNGRVVGKNRPDLQYTLNGKRNYVEYDTVASDRGPAHAVRIAANDPSARLGSGIDLITQN